MGRHHASGALLGVGRSGNIRVDRLSRNLNFLDGLTGDYTWDYSSWNSECPPEAPIRRKIHYGSSVYNLGPEQSLRRTVIASVASNLRVRGGTGKQTKPNMFPTTNDMSSAFIILSSTVLRLWLCMK
jgi:hypothetical protein